MKRRQVFEMLLLSAFTLKKKISIVFSQIFILHKKGEGGTYGIVFNQVEALLYFLR